MTKSNNRDNKLNRIVLHELLYEQAASYFDMFGYHIFPGAPGGPEKAFTEVKHVDKRQLVSFSVYIGTSPVSGTESLVVEGKLDSYVCYTGIISADPEDYKYNLESVYLIMMKKLNDLLRSNKFERVKNIQQVLPDKVEESF